jgi:hypothetical protein
MRKNLQVCFISLLFLGLMGLFFVPQREPRIPTRPDAKSAVLFDGQILHIKLSLKAKEYDSLRREPRSYVPGVFRQGDNRLEVGVRLKGHATFLPISQKPSFTIKFDKHQKGQTWSGLTKVALNNSIDDRSYLRELAANASFRAAGVPAPRVGHAYVSLNERDLGLYTVIEGIDDCFLGQFFPDTEGDLWEGESSDIDDQLQHDAGPGTATCKVAGLRRAIQEQNPSQRLERVSSFLDVERFMSYLVIEALVGSSDGYTGNVNNYRLYHDPGSGKLVLFPHGLDRTFGHPDVAVLLRRRGILSNALLDIPQLQCDYRSRIAALVEVLNSTGSVYRVISKVACNLTNSACTRSERTILHADISEFVANFSERYESVKTRLRQGVLFPIRFQDAALRVTNWTPRLNSRLSTEGKFDGEQGSVRIPAQGRAVPGLWSAEVLLNRGEYSFTGTVKFQEVTEEEPTGCGARIRVQGNWEGAMVKPTHSWIALDHRFAVKHDMTRVELICEFMSLSGIAYFGNLELSFLSAHRMADDSRK